ncbi:MAG: DNA polymerase [Dehalococcoidia bacterium]
MPKRPRQGGMISLDSETTGLDLRHGARPYYVSTCDEDGCNVSWEWRVDPLTRRVVADRGDLKDLQRKIDGADKIVLQNPKFDFMALSLLFNDYSMELRWDWAKIYDTLLAGHLLASNQPHDLTTMAMVYLQANVQPYEDRLRKVTLAARSWARTNRPDWRQAKEGLPEMPSAKSTVWKYDCWMPRLVHEEGGGDETWETVLSEYGDSDASVTLPLFKRQQQILKQKHLWRIYEERLKVLPVVAAIENYGVTLHAGRLEEKRTEYAEASQDAHRTCLNIAKRYGYELTLPKSGNNKSLTEFVFSEEGMHLPPLKKSKKTGVPSLDKTVLEQYSVTLPRNSKPLMFVTALMGKRKRDTAYGYLESYKKFWVHTEHRDRVWYRLHPSLNPTGTDTLRWSSQNPNEQNISKKEGFNLRYCFGPAPGRVWYSCDAKNLELRFPAYEANEPEMVYLFEHPNDPPYYGSYHMLIFDTLHPKLFAKHGMESKEAYASTWYQWTKNGDFAVQYGAVLESGTADRAYHVPGAQARIQSRFNRIKKLNAQQIAYAEKYGYVETMPDKTVDPDHGYPLWCGRTSYGRIMPTVPLNYHVSGTACWWMMKGMIRCHNYLQDVGDDYHIVMQIHDEQVFDFPDDEATNKPIIEQCMKLMAQGGDDLGVPTPVSCTKHSTTWSTGS